MAEYGRVQGAKAQQDWIEKEELFWNDRVEVRLVVLPCVCSGLTVFRFSTVTLAVSPVNWSTGKTRPGARKFKEVVLNCELHRVALCLLSFWNADRLTHRMKEKLTELGKVSNADYDWKEF